MNVPDGAVYAALPLFGSICTWALSSFIRQNIGPKGDRGSPGQDAPEMTVKSYNLIADRLIKELNGRYMRADEARERFDCIETKLDTNTQNIINCLRVGKQNE